MYSLILLMSLICALLVSVECRRTILSTAVFKDRKCDGIITQDFAVVAQREPSPLPQSFEMRLRKAMPLLQQSGRWVISAMFVMLALRMGAILENMPSDLPKLIRTPSIATTKVLLALNSVGVLVSALIPTTSKRFTKPLMLANLVRETAGFGLNLILLVSFGSRGRIVQAETVFGQLFLNFVWMVFILSLTRSRWVSTPTPMINMESEEAKKLFLSQSDPPQFIKRRR